jgi:hypothetical protein
MLNYLFQILGQTRYTVFIRSIEYEVLHTCLRVLISCFSFFFHGDVCDVLGRWQKPLTIVNEHVTAIKRPNPPVLQVYASDLCNPKTLLLLTFVLILKRVATYMILNWYNMKLIFKKIIVMLNWCHKYCQFVL